jgi:phosphate transport system permease protein
MPPSVTATASDRVPTRVALYRKSRGKFLGLTADRMAKRVFQANAAISILVLALITYTIFKDALDFIPQNRTNLQVYRLAGLEFVDLLRRPVEAYTSLNRELSSIRSAELAQLQHQGLTPADAMVRLKPLDDFANRIADAIDPLNGILSDLTEAATGLKERQKVAQDMAEARENLQRALVTAAPTQVPAIRHHLDAIVVEEINFQTEVKPMRDRLTDVHAASAKLGEALAGLAREVPAFPDAAVQKRLDRIGRLIGAFPADLREATQAMDHWNQLKPVSWWESSYAFIFGRDWITASFWQDWYGVLPLFFGSLLISALALLLAIPLGVAAAIYVNQVARPLEQRLIKPVIEFIAAIPSVVLGFFGIAVLGESLRALSQWPALAWVPGFPMAERLNATTAACLLAFMAIPTIFTLAEDAINNVPRSFREASLAMGATRLQTLLHIILPAALSGIMAAVLLGLGRVIGETMVVLLCAGNRIQTPDFSAGLGALFQPVHTMTGIIAQEMGEVVRGSLHYRALFMVGVVLFLISLLINWLAQKVVRRYRLPAT